MDNEKLYSTKEAAEFLGVDRKTIQNYRKRGILTPDLEGKNNSVLYKESQLIDVAKFLSSSGDTFLKRSPKTLQNFAQVGNRSENLPFQVGNRSENLPFQVGNRSENSPFQVGNRSENSHFEGVKSSEKCNQEHKMFVDNQVESSQSATSFSIEVGTSSENLPSQVGNRSENSPFQVGNRSENSPFEKCNQENKKIIDNEDATSSEVGTSFENELADTETCDINFENETDGKKKKKREIVKASDYVKPTSLVMANTKLSNYMFDTSKDLTELTALIVSGKKEEEVTIKTRVFLSLEGDLGLKLSQNLTAYDRAVHDGVCSVIANININDDKVTITNRQIYEAMTGRATTSPQALGHVTRSMNKLNRTRVFVDYTDQASAKGIECEKMFFRGNVLDFQEVEIVFNKQQSIVGYKILTKPILYKYALEMGQVISVNSALLNSPHVANTDDSIVLKHYLLRRIENMKNSANNVDSNKILFDTMFDYCNISDDNRKQLHRKREVVMTMLQDWKNVDYIRGFTEYKGNKNKILGVEITF